MRSKHYDLAYGYEPCKVLPIVSFSTFSGLFSVFQSKKKYMWVMVLKCPFLVFLSVVFSVLLPVKQISSDSSLILTIF